MEYGTLFLIKRFVIKKDGYELILDQNYKPVYDPVVVGTYNFHTYKSIAKNPIDFVSHVKDVNLWKKYGTGPNDPIPLSLVALLFDFLFKLEK